MYLIIFFLWSMWRCFKSYSGWRVVFSFFCSVIMRFWVLLLLWIIIIIMRVGRRISG